MTKNLLFILTFSIILAWMAILGLTQVLMKKKKHKFSLEKSIEQEEPLENISGLPANQNEKEVLRVSSLVQR